MAAGNRVGSDLETWTSLTLKVTLYGVDERRHLETAVDWRRASTRFDGRPETAVDVIRRTTDQKVGGSTPSERAEFVRGTGLRVLT
jgi:hypothetical protein